MKLRVGEEKIKGFSSTVKKAERTNDWAWWALFGAVVVMVINDIEKVSSGDPKKIARRVKNRVIGRKIIRKVWKLPF